MTAAVVSFLLAITCWWAGRSSSRPSVVRFKLYWAGMCFFALGFGAAYMQVLEWRSPKELAQYLPPYPYATVHSRSPVPIDHARAWVFETSDTPRRVANFYSHVARTNGWQIKRELTQNTEVLVMRQLETITTVVASYGPKKTEITYLVRPVEPPLD
jgi:hypothetical protein